MLIESSSVPFPFSGSEFVLTPTDRLQLVCGPRLHRVHYGIFNWRSVHFGRTLFLFRFAGSIFLPVFPGEAVLVRACTR